jgi:arginyl-tRNA synthetase
VVLRSDGTATYPVADIPLANAKQDKFKSDISIYVVDNRQELYFKQLFAILKKMGHPEEMKHLKYDFVKLPSGMMSSRSGNTVTYEKLKEELIKVLRQETKERHPDWGDVQIEEIIKTLAIATIKYELLKVGAEQVITFDIKEALSFSGNTAAYILYTYARMQSIMRKADVKIGKKVDIGDLEKQEEELLVKLSKYPDIVREASKRYDPSVVCKYVFELSQQINDFYHQINILKSEDKLKLQRLKLLEDCSRVLELGLGLLGIRTIEKM